MEVLSHHAGVLKDVLILYLTFPQYLLMIPLESRMRANGKSCVAPVFAIALLLGATLLAPLFATALVLPPGGLAATQSNRDLVLSFPTTTPRLYTVQAGP